MLKRLLLLLLFAFPVMAQRNAISFDAWMAMQTHTFPALDTNNAFTNANSFINAGVFTNTQMNEYLQSNLNGCLPATVFDYANGSNQATDALSGCIIVPLGATNLNSQSVAGYCINKSTTSNCAGGYFSVQAGVNHSFNWGINPNCGDSSTFGFFTNTFCVNEFDINVSSTTTTVEPILINGSFSAQPGAGAGINIVKPVQAGACTTCTWPIGINFTTGATLNGLAINLGAAASGNSQNSQGINFNSTSSGGGNQIASIYEDPSASLHLTPPATSNYVDVDANLQIHGTIGNTAGTAIMGLTTKTGSGSANYTGANTAALAAVDTTNLCISVTVPTGWKLTVTASGMAGTATGAVAANVALADAGITCTSGGVSALAGSNRQYTPAALATFDIGFTTQATITGDGAVHSVILVASTTNAADSWLIQNTAGLGPSMVGLLTPSN